MNGLESSGKKVTIARIRIEQNAAFKGAGIFLKMPFSLKKLKGKFARSNTPTMIKTTGTITGNSCFMTKK